ncbi:hypothetical protein DACRYDRAFT_110314 [Dacryopinax primogenitus]|uniref:Uncharacterized protein n=1 Tax=Dacryopinax primogenitus (strain DJM 731) TaxID=1858805 RepID=M5FSR4_DACPD|nr:uncharacterized protein DACRYDRAFT_110314 [Dacryopinax primogenitus]EJT98983.1 hypothetical protein DACRYDRAFT_110314 [Dacryopinax primogenitus]
MSFAVPSVPRPPSHILLSSTITSIPKDNLSVQDVTQGMVQQSSPPAVPIKPVEELFSLDFHSPSGPAIVSTARKDSKSDILSLFGTSTTPAATAMWGAQTTSTIPQPFPLHRSVSTPTSNHTATFGADIWSGQSDPFASFGTTSSTPSGTKNDAFSDLWGDFK